VSAQAREQVAKAPVSGSYRATTPDDGVERIYSYMKVAGYPYRVYVAKSVAETFGPWWLEVVAALLLVAGFAAFLAFYARDGLRSLRTKEREDKQVLARSEARFRAIVANSHDGIIFADAQGIILYRSPSYRLLNGYEDHYRLGQSGFETVHPEDLPGVREAWDRMLAHPAEHVHATYRIMHRDGSWKWVDATLQNLLDNAEAGVVIVTSRDLTDQREAAARQRAMEAQLNHLQRMEGIGRLAGGISHDMNNVLAAIMSVGETLKHLDPDRAPLVDLILEASRRGRNLVKGLMTFARKDIEKVEPVDLNAIVQEQARILSSTMLQRIQVRLDLAEDLPTLTGSSTALFTALMNLCVNAMDAMPEGGILTLRTRMADAATVELMVGDTGHGMAPDILSRAMEPFFTTKALGLGTGLGLATVYGTAQAHGGRLDLQSQVGKGTEIHLYLPVALKGAPTASVADPAADDPGPLGRILLVDDDEQVRRATRMMLEARGHVVTDVAGGYAALKLAEAGTEWEVAVLDMNMPGLNGTETLALLRAQQPDLPIILATGYADQELIVSLRALERVVLLNKPFSFQEFQSAWRGLA
jgi:PAS domain S-box-containing protein